MINFIVLQENKDFYFGYDCPNETQTALDYLQHVKKMKSEGVNLRNDYCRLIHKNNSIGERNVCSSFSAYVLDFDINDKEVIQKWRLDSRTFADYDVKKFQFLLNYKN